MEGHASISDFALAKAMENLTGSSAWLAIRFLLIRRLRLPCQIAFGEMARDNQKQIPST
jgi:hypothetical protein